MTTQLAPVGPYVIPARDIREGDTLRGYYAPGVTLAAAACPGQYAPDWSDADRRPLMLPLPYRAKEVTGRPRPARRPQARRRQPRPRHPRDGAARPPDEPAGLRGLRHGRR
ncbi:hypothetical protein [Streptomyces carpinensis]|uniref:Uncharacterized protein n=1 Tax=Streptomyces carpinensis TaxID=66369 RepID=A0ABV1W625_9ACTN|nr:hypothetical protein [Streptomyces carpinensis]